MARVGIAQRRVLAVSIKLTKALTPLSSADGAGERLTAAFCVRPLNGHKVRVPGGVLAPEVLKLAVHSICTRPYPRQTLHHARADTSQTAPGRPTAPSL